MKLVDVTKAMMMALLFIGITPVKADVIVLIHGYLGSANSWEDSGINQQLENAGWQRSGVYAVTPDGIRLFASPTDLAKKKAYSVDLLSQVSISGQSQQLIAILTQITTKHPEESITLVAHSAGGIVARLSLINYPHPNIKHLITIASPHSGTMRAFQGLKETEGGLWGMVKGMLGGKLYHQVRQSRPLLFDLLTPRPGNFLDWLNQQQHPNIRYTSIITTHPYGEGDAMVTAFSQNMNHVPALRGQSEVIRLQSNHELDNADGALLVWYLNQ